MKTFWLITLLAACTILVEGADRALAQNPNPYRQPQPPPSPYGLLQRPTVSPYLGLLQRNNNRNSNNLGLNYYSLVRPEIQTRDVLRRQHAEQQQLSAENQDLQQQLLQVSQQPTEVAADPLAVPTYRLRPTGHGVSRMNTGGYFGGHGGR